MITIAIECVSVCFMYALHIETKRVHFESRLVGRFIQADFHMSNAYFRLIGQWLYSFQKVISVA